MKTKLVIGAILVVALAGGAYLYTQYKSDVGGIQDGIYGTPQAGSSKGKDMSYNDGRGFAFNYPVSYKMDETVSDTLVSPNGYIGIGVEQDSSIDSQELTTTVGDRKWKVYEAGNDGCGSRVYSTNLASSVLSLSFGSCPDDLEPHLRNDLELIEDILSSVSER